MLTQAPRTIEPSTLSIDETAAYLGVSRGTVFNLRKDKARNFPPPAPLSLRHKRYQKADIEAYAKYGANWKVATLR
jgi:predicted DNA-binding transcriptional regulator AlpA